VDSLPLHGPGSPTIRVATYNIHKARGLDGRDRLDRIADVLGEIGATVVALQEVFAVQAERLAAITGMHAVFGPTRRGTGGPYGNLCLTRLAPLDHAHYDLTWRASEPRGCLRVDLVSPGPGTAPLHVFNVHLGLGYRERVWQARQLSQVLHPGRLAGPRLLLGDFNEWFHGGASRLLGAEIGSAAGRRRGPRTHPSPWPVFPLDRIYLDAAVRLEGAVTVHRSRLARVASDHLPAYADLRLPGGAGAAGGPRG
jgi:endonuclease/exonuclease/phosphatase family metal-dependent hydrolase